MIDFRGQAMIADDSASDTQLFRTRLAASDCIVVALNGAKLRPLVAALAAAETGSEADSAYWSSSPLDEVDYAYREELRQFAVNVSRAVQTRQEAGASIPSLVLLITKADLLASIPGVPMQRAMALLEQQLPELVNVVGNSGTTALVCPVTVGDIGEGKDTIDSSALRPRYTERPLVFALTQLLDAEIARRTAALFPPASPQPAAAVPLPIALGKGLIEAFQSVWLSRGGWAGKSVASRPDPVAVREAELAALAEVRVLADRLRSRLRGMAVFVDGALKKL